MYKMYMVFIYFSDIYICMCVCIHIYSNDIYMYSSDTLFQIIYYNLKMERTLVK